MIRATVPCDGCTACCRNEAVILTPEDDASQYETEPSRLGPRLKRKADGSCFYLGDSGCTIHGRAPVMCKVYDCRAQYSMYSRLTRRKMVSQGLLDPRILEEGRKRVHTLETVR